MKREVDFVGQWYLRPDTHETFQLIDWDDLSGTARVQMCDGSLDEFDQDNWRALAPEPVSAENACLGAKRNQDGNGVGRGDGPAPVPAGCDAADLAEYHAALRLRHVRHGNVCLLHPSPS